MRPALSLPPPTLYQPPPTTDYPLPTTHYPLPTTRTMLFWPAGGSAPLFPHHNSPAACFGRGCALTPADNSCVRSRQPYRALHGLRHHSHRRPALYAMPQMRRIARCGHRHQPRGRSVAVWAEHACQPGAIRRLALPGASSGTARAAIVTRAEGWTPMYVDDRFSPTPVFAPRPETPGPKSHRFLLRTVV